MTATTRLGEDEDSKSEESCKSVMGSDGCKGHRQELLQDRYWEGEERTFMFNKWTWYECGVNTQVGMSVFPECGPE